MTPRRAAVRVGLQALEAELRRERRRAVVDKYARKTPKNQPAFCTPRAGQRQHSAGKVIFPDLAAAEAAAAELGALPGARPMEPYLCDRSRHGHLHLRTQRPASSARPGESG